MDATVTSCPTQRCLEPPGQNKEARRRQAARYQSSTRLDLFKIFEGLMDSCIAAGLIIG